MAKISNLQSFLQAHVKCFFATEEKKSDKHLLVLIVSSVKWLQNMVTQLYFC